MRNLRLLALAAAIVASGILLGGSIYDSLVLAPNMNGHLPQSLEQGRQFMHAATPASFFRLISPLTQITLLLAVIFCWKVRVARWWPVIGLLAALAGDGLTFAYFYPRNALLFGAPLAQPVEVLAAAAHEWAQMNWVRVALVTLAMVSALTALTKVAAAPESARQQTGSE